MNVSSNKIVTLLIYLVAEKYCLVLKQASVNSVFKNHHLLINYRGGSLYGEGFIKIFKKQKMVGRYMRQSVDGSANKRRTHSIALSKCQRQNMISAFEILFNFSTAAERQEFYSGTSAMRRR